MTRTSGPTNRSFRMGIFFSQNPENSPTIRYWCEICQESVGRQGDFGRHMERHSGTFQYMCNYSGCRQIEGGNGFHQKSNLLSHIENAHHPENGLLCPHMWMNQDGTMEDCQARYKTKSLLSQHRKQAHGFKRGDDSLMILVPTVVGSVFGSRHGDSRPGRSGNCAGAIVYFPDACGDDPSAMREFSEYLFSKPQQLAQSLALLNVPYPHQILPFSWPKGTRRKHWQTAAKSSPKSTPAPEWYAQIALSFSGSAPGNPLPYPLIPPTLANRSSASNHGVQHNQPYNPRPPALAPFFTNPSAPISPVPPVPPPQARPAPMQGMPTPGMPRWTAPLGGLNSIFGRVDYSFVPMPCGGPPASAVTGTVGQTLYTSAFSASHWPARDVVTTPSRDIFIPPPIPLTHDVGVASSISYASDFVVASPISYAGNVGIAPSISHVHDIGFAPPGSSAHVYGAGPGTLPAEANIVSGPEVESIPSAADLDDQYFADLLSKLPRREDEFAEWVSAFLAQAPLAQ